ncbi:MAG TPA: FMN-binding negative transcriptional regulator [Gammaproteobacteria bacterium]
MYNPSHFRQQDPAELHALLRAHPLATLVVQGGDGLEASQVPLLFDPAAGAHGTLRGHLARANPLWRAAVGGCPALALFHGPQGYVSPGWYPTKREDPRVVPTWNYAVVHAHGTLRAIDDPAWLRGVVTALTATHEASRAEPWQVSDAPADYLERQLRAIVGIELALTRLEGKWKLSQNRAEADRAGVAAGLEGDGDASGRELAGLMRLAAERSPPR